MRLHEPDRYQCRSRIPCGTTTVIDLKVASTVRPSQQTFGLRHFPARQEVASTVRPSQQTFGLRQFPACQVKASAG